MAARYRWDDFVLDLDAYRLERAGVALALEPKALNLLALMVQRPGHLFTKQEIFEAVWPDTIVTDHALTRVVAQLRRVLGDEAREARYIETVPTRGYRWIPAVALETVAAPAAPAEPAAAPAPERFISDSPARGQRRALFPGLAATLSVAMILFAIFIWTPRQSSTSATSAAVTVATSAASDVQWPVQLTTHDGLDLQPALSPHGDAVAFASDRGGSLEIFVRTLHGTATETQLTQDQGHNVQPAWSPNGSLIAYHSSRTGGIWIMPARGGLARQVASFGSHPSWSPDGRQLAFQSDEHADVTPMAFGAQSGSTIWIVDADGSRLRELTRTGRPIGGHSGPVWSRDGRFVAFSVFDGGSNDGLWIVPLDTGDARLLHQEPGLYELAFAPDNSALYAAGGEAAIVALPFDPSTGRIAGPRRLIPVPGVTSVRGLTISHDGGQIAFAGLALSSQLWTQRVNANGSPSAPAAALTRDTSRRNSVPAIAPDGSKVAYLSTRRGELPNVWVIDIDGGRARQITPNETAESKPHWFPDSRRLAYLSSRRDGSGIWSVDLATLREELLIDITRAIAQPSEPPPLRGRLAELDLAPSMTRAAFSLVSPPAGRRVIYLTGTDRFTPVALTDGTTSVGYPSWSPDERRIAVEIKDGSSMHAGVIDVATGALRQLTRERGQTWVRGWSPDGRRIVVAAFRGGVWSLRWIDVESGREGEMTPAGASRVYVRYPDWSPRGDVVVFERGELKGNIWTLRVN